MKNYTITVFSESNAAVLDTIMSVFSYRNINIDRVKTEKSSVAGIRRFIINVSTNNNRMENVARQIEKNVFILKANIQHMHNELTETEEKNILKNYIN